MSLSLIPPHVLVGLITIDRHVNVHVIDSPSEVVQKYVFPGTMAQTTKTVQSHLGITRMTGDHLPMTGKSSPINSCIRSVGDCEIQFQEMLMALKRTNWPIQRNRRPLRASGAALSIAASILEAANICGRILTFLGGPCSHGPGMVVDDDLENSLRSHRDIENGNCRHMEKAKIFYESLATNASQNGHVVDIFACSPYQVGLYEMRSLANYTGGHMILCESFNSKEFQTSYQHVFARDEKGNLDMAFNATLEIKTSRQLEVDYILGPCFL